MDPLVRMYESDNNMFEETTARVERSNECARSMDTISTARVDRE